MTNCEMCVNKSCIITCGNFKAIRKHFRYLSFGRNSKYEQSKKPLRTKYHLRQHYLRIPLHGSRYTINRVVKRSRSFDRRKKINVSVKEYPTFFATLRILNVSASDRNDSCPNEPPKHLKPCSDPQCMYICMAHTLYGSILYSNRPA